jgi:hypothetical protein
MERSPVDSAKSSSGDREIGVTMRPMTSEAFVRDVIAEHVDQVVTLDQRSRNSVWFIACDRSPTDYLVHLPVDEIPPNATDDECRYIAGFFAETVAQLDVQTGMAVVLTRPGSPVVGEVDRRWYRAVHDSCAEHDLRLLGVHLLTPRGSRELHFDDVM